MANRDDYRGYGGGQGGDRERDRWGRDDDNRRGWGAGDERRSFDDRGRYNSDQARYGGTRGGHGEGEGQAWQRERYGSRHDQDRTNYGSGYDRERGGYGAGQAYGADRTDDRAYGSRADRQSRGYQEFGVPADYGYRPQGQQAQDHDHEYARWRDEQMRGHDRDYQEWRRHTQGQYDDDYRKFRTERRDTFGKSFHEWRSQRNASNGTAQSQIGPESHDYGRRMGAGFGQGEDRPSGMPEGPGGLTSSSTLGQNSFGGGSGGGTAAGTGSTSKTASSGSEFGKEPSAVQATTDGKVQGKDSDDRQH
ncbi:hypothetical protein [Phenylobacterium sp. J367]|uniref:hypothetical protein n=1 Tax=Phenylobacterium sp. J367 TaxID=2898435 RepID=UPI0021511D62|nr:hypothetical protein [Phenylobacterium sp. J367]MCR5880649.1 hypothetical protein [Phenylobacterium sp. J367]